ncbi:hypothetical protein ACWD5Q_32140 [Streptomyces sp. NPDC002513]
MAKQLQEVQAEREELVIAERVLNRLAEAVVTEALDKPDHLGSKGTFAFPFKITPPQVKREGEVVPQTQTGEPGPCRPRSKGRQSRPPGSSLCPGVRDLFAFFT